MLINNIVRVHVGIQSLKVRFYQKLFYVVLYNNISIVGSYESGIASYKHMYFNATMNSLKIWITIVVGIVTFYETVKYLIWLAFQQRLRLSMMLLFSTAVFSHYYSWWVYINYWNDDFYSQWYHQLFFSITELISTFLVVHLADKKNLITHRKAFGIIAIAILHIVAGGWDQFVANVVRGEGYAHQVNRYVFKYIQLDLVDVNK